jgi:hypothetical protein
MNTHCHIPEDTVFTVAAVRTSYLTCIFIEQKRIKNVYATCSTENSQQQSMQFIKFTYNVFMALSKVGFIVAKYGWKLKLALPCQIFKKSVPFMLHHREMDGQRDVTSTYDVWFYFIYGDWKGRWTVIKDARFYCLITAYFLNTDTYAHPSK